MPDVFRVIHGAYKGDFQLVGRTVGELKMALAYALHNAVRLIKEGL
jgi:hypothetical protein